jgi:hypothetical protein
MKLTKGSFSKRYSYKPNQYWFSKLVYNGLIGHTIKERGFDRKRDYSYFKHACSGLQYV